MQANVGSDACACLSSWAYEGKVFAGCDETAPDWIGTSWCYVQDPIKCTEAKASFNELETRRWLECDIGSVKTFATVVRPHLLRGDLGAKQMDVFRALPAGDAATEGFEGKIIDTTYFYTPVAGWDLRLALVLDKFDLTQITLHPKSTSRVITSQLKDYLYNDRNKALADMIPNLQFINNKNCDSFTNCKPDVYCDRILKNMPHPVGVVPNSTVQTGLCNPTSTCICEPHRWPIGLTAKAAASLHIAPKSLVDSQTAYDLSDGIGAIAMTDAAFANLTYALTRFLNRDSHSSNPSLQTLRQDALQHALTSAPLADSWVKDQAKGIHNDTVWLYYGSGTGSSLVFPPNNWGFLWDPTRRPWYGRAISSGDKVSFHEI